MENISFKIDGRTFEVGPHTFCECCGKQESSDVVYSNDYTSWCMDCVHGAGVIREDDEENGLEPFKGWDELHTISDKLSKLRSKFEKQLQKQLQKEVKELVSKL